MAEALPLRLGARLILTGIVREDASTGDGFSSSSCKSCISG